MMANRPRSAPAAPAEDPASLPTWFSKLLVKIEKGLDRFYSIWYNSKVRAYTLEKRYTNLFTSWNERRRR
jgi:hypothetical protein